MGEKLLELMWTERTQYNPLSSSLSPPLSLLPSLLLSLLLSQPAGNDCRFEYNSLSDLCYEVTDSGAFYTGRSWIDRGNVILHSTFKNIVTTEKVYLGSPSVQAIYLDDQANYTSLKVPSIYIIIVCTC